MKKFTLYLFLIFLFCIPNLFSQTYNINLTGYVKSKDKNLECHTHVKLIYYLSSGKSIHRVLSMTANHNEGTPWISSDSFTTNERITAIKCVGVHADNPSGNKSCYTVDEGSNFQSINESDYPCANIRFTRIIGKYDNGSYIDIRIEPADIQINYHNPIQYGNEESPGIDFLHESIPISISATQGYPTSVYNWEYSIGDLYSWNTLGSEFMSNEKTEITLKATDQLSYEQIIRKTPVYIRINCDCNGFKTSNRIDLQPKIAAPTFKQVIGKTDESCPGNADGEIIVEFNRPLFPEETIEFLAKDELQDLFFPMKQEMIGNNRCRIYNLPPGTYTFQIKGSYIDHHGDKISTGIIVGDNEYSFTESIETGTSPTFELIDYGGITCTGGNDGWITAKGEDGSGEYKLVCESQSKEIFESDFHDSGVSINNLPAGKYNVWVTDSKGCMTDIYPERINITSPLSPIKTDKISIFNPIEGENSGSISVSVKDGTPPYQAIWRDGDESGAILGSDTQSGGGNNEISTIKNRGKGTYFVEFTDANGCKTSEIITLEALPVFEISIIQTSDIECHGDKTSGLSATVNEGGSGIYTKYEWFEVDDNLAYYQIGENNAVLSGVGGGQYRMKVTDSNGNQSWSNIVTIPQPDPIKVSFSNNTLKCRGDNNGEVTALISGGAGNYEWTWSNGESGTGTDSHLMNLYAGTYALSINDENSCQASFENEIAEPEELSVSGNISPPSCFGMNNGQIIVFINGGTPDYRINSSEINGYGTTINNLYAGKHMVTVTDKFGCEVVEKEFEIPEPIPVSAYVSRLSHVSRNGEKDGSVQILIAGGSPPYKAKCRDEKNNSYVVPGINYPTGQPAILEIKNLQEGDYTVILQDAFYQNRQDKKDLACSHTVEFSISQPPPLIIKMEESHHVTCNNGTDGQLTIYAEGGSPYETGEPYQYKWYRQLGPSRIFIEGSENMTTLENLSPGIYLTEVIDKNNASTFSSPYTLVNPQIIKMQFKTAVLTCASDSTGWVEAKVAGGQGAFLYEWSTGETGVSRIDKKPGGWYSLSVEDERGCHVIDSTFITSPKSIQVSYKSRPPLCDGHGDAYISMIISGGEAPYSYKWSNGDTTAYLDDIYPGIYSVRITDDLNCYRDTTFIIPEIKPVTAKLEEIISPLAFGYSDGSIRVNISGGTLPYSISWKNDYGESIKSENTEENEIIVSSISSIPEGNYHLFVEDNNYPLTEQPSSFPSCGCLFSLSFYVPEPPKLDVELENTKIIRCFRSDDGEFIAHAKGGVPNSDGLPYTYEWYKDGSPIGRNDSILSELGEGSYYVKIIDANGIIIESEHIFLKEPQVLSVVASASDLRCSRDTNGWAQAEVSGGTKPYYYNWSNGSNSPRIENIPRGKYFVYVTDENGCEVTATASIAQLNGIKAEATLIPPVCHNGTNGEIHLNISGGQAPYSYQWENGQKALIRSGLQAGNYNITITDANNCSHEVFTYTLPHPDSIIINLGKDITLCNGQSKLINAESDENVVSYAWFDQTGFTLSDKQSIMISNPGQYIVKIMTNKGCYGAGNINVERDNRVIANDFLIASQVPINDDVLVVNISDPAPDKIEWILPKGEGSVFEVIENNEDILNLIFRQYGNFTIGMISYSGNCTETAYKTVQVMDKENISNYEDADESVLKSFAVYPNPNPGYFEASIEIKEDTPATLILVNSGSGKILERRTLKGKKIHKEIFNITGNEKGTYILNLYSPKINSAKKVIIK